MITEIVLEGIQVDHNSQLEGVDMKLLVQNMVVVGPLKFLHNVKIKVSTINQQ